MIALVLWWFQLGWIGVVGVLAVLAAYELRCRRISRSAGGGKEGARSPDPGPDERVPRPGVVATSPLE